MYFLELFGFELDLSRGLETQFVSRVSLFVASSSGRSTHPSSLLRRRPDDGAVACEVGGEALGPPLTGDNWRGSSSATSYNCGLGDGLGESFIRNPYKEGDTHWILGDG